MARDLTLRIKVTDLEKLREIRSLVGDLKSVGPAAKASLSEAAKNVDSLAREFAELRTEIKSGFSSLATEFQKLSAGIREMGRAAQTADAAAAAGSKRRIAANKEEELTVKALIKQQQKLYESRLVQGRSGWQVNDLRQLKTMGVQLSPVDRQLLEEGRANILAYDKQTSELQSAMFRRINAQVKALEQTKTLQQQREAAEARALLKQEALLEKQKVLNAKFLSEATSAATKYRIASNVHSYLNQFGPGGDVGAALAGAINKFGSAAVQFAGDEQAMRTLRAEIDATTGSKRKFTQESVASRTEIARGRAPILAHAAAVNNAKDAYAALHSTLRGTAGGMGQIWLSWGKPLAALWAGFAGASAIRQSITQFADFQHQLVMTKAVAEESDTAISKLRDSALELGTAGKFGAQEFASAYRVLAQAGLNAGSARAALPSIKDFAMVGEMNLDQAAEQIIGIANAFGEPISNIGRIGDIIAKAATLSQASVSDLTMAMRQASTVAEQFRIDATETAAILSVLARRNIVGSRAGTAMRNFYKEITTPGKDAQALLDHMSIKPYDDVTKRMRPIVDIMADMKAAMEQLDQASQNRVFDVFFGERGGKVGSAALNALEEVKRLIEEIGNATGFTAYSAALIENESLSVRWASALNTLRATFITTGEDSHTALVRVADALKQAFGNDALKSTLGGLLNALASLVEIIVGNGGKVAVALGSYFSVKMIGGMASLAGATLAAAVNARSLAAQYGIATASLYNFDRAALQSAAASGTLATATAGVAGGLGAIGASIRAALPILGMLITAVGVASVAWETFRTKKNDALKEMPKSFQDSLTANEAAMANLRARAEAAQNFLDKRTHDPSADVAIIEQRNRVRMDIEKQRQAALEQNRKEMEDDDRLARWHNVPSRAQDNSSSINSLFDAKLREADLKFERMTAELRAQGKVTSELELQALQKKQEEDRMRFGDKALDLDSILGKGSGWRQFTDPSGKQFSEIKAMYNLRTSDFQKEIADAEKLNKLYFQARLITEEEYYKRSEALQKQQADFRVRQAEQMLNVELPAYAAKRRKNIEEDAKYTPKQKQEQLATLDAQVQRNREELGSDLYQARREQTQTLAELEVQAKIRQNEQMDKLDRAREQTELRREQDLLNLRLQTADQTTRAVESRRYEVERRFADIRRAAQISGNKEYEAQVEKTLNQIIELETAAARQIAEAEKDMGFGAMRGARRYLDEVENVAAFTEQMVLRTAGAIEDVFVQMATTGKISIKDLVNSVIADFTRLAVRKSITGPLMNAFFGSLGGPSTGNVIPTARSPYLVQALNNHTGGIVGYEASGRSLVSSALFHGAPRYHTGGIAGDEVPIIAKRGEGVFTEGQMKALGGTAKAPNVEVNVINNGQPTDVERTTTQFDGEKMIVSVFLKDLAKNGPMSRALSKGRR